MNFFAPQTAITVPIQAHIRNWATHWTDRHGNYMAPEAMGLAAIGTPAWTRAWGDLFAEDANGYLNPLRASWFVSLPQTAARGDVGRLDAACGPHPVGRALARFLLQRLGQEAWLRDQAGLEVCPTMPQELRDLGVSVPAVGTWTSENNRIQQEREIAATTQLLEDLLASEVEAEISAMGPSLAEQGGQNLPSLAEQERQNLPTWLGGPTMLGGPPTATPPGSVDPSPIPMPSPRTVNLVAVRQAAESTARADGRSDLARLQELTGFRPPPEIQE